MWLKFDENLQKVTTVMMSLGEPKETVWTGFSFFFFFFFFFPPPPPLPPPHLLQTKETSVLPLTCVSLFVLLKFGQLASVIKIIFEYIAVCCQCYQLTRCCRWNNRELWCIMRRLIHNDVWTEAYSASIQVFNQKHFAVKMYLDI